MSKLTIDDMLEAKKKLDRYKMPAGIVTSINSKARIEDQMAKDSEELDPFLSFGVDIFAFGDVPEGKALVFYERERLVSYLKGRADGKSHLHALADTIKPEDWMEREEMPKPNLIEDESLRCSKILEEDNDKGGISLNRAVGVIYDLIKGNIPLEITTPYDVGYPSVKVEVGGYKISFFIDAGEVDYIEFMKSPDGEISTFDNFSNQYPDGRFGCPLDMLSEKERDTLQDLLLN